MTNNTVLKRTLTVFMAFTMLIMAVCGFTGLKASAAEPVRVISDENATAYIYANGTGYLTLNRTFTLDDQLTEIDGVPLKEIITFINGGYIDSIYSHLNGNGIIYDHCLAVTGKAPTGPYGGTLRIYDATNDRYFLTLLSSKWMAHYVYYNSDKPEVQRIEWFTL